nr:Chain P, upain-1-W3F [synthetic construct]
CSFRGLENHAMC